MDAYDTWLELKATDDKNQTVFWSGMVEDNGKARWKKPHYRSLQIGGTAIHQQAQRLVTRSVVYVRLIPPGAADTVHYRIHSRNCRTKLPACPALLPQVLPGGTPVRCGRP